MKKQAVFGVPPQIILRLILSFLMDHQPRVKIGDTLSDWVSPNGGMLRGTYLTFLSLIDDLKTLLELRKFVDECTLTEIIQELNTSCMLLKLMVSTLGRV